MGKPTEAKPELAREYRAALRVIIGDARDITNLKRVPDHLRAAVKSHAASLARRRLRHVSEAP